MKIASTSEFIKIRKSARRPFTFSSSAAEEGRGRWKELSEKTPSDALMTYLHGIAMDLENIARPGETEQISMGRPRKKVGK